MKIDYSRIQTAIADADEAGDAGGWVTMTQLEAIQSIAQDLFIIRSLLLSIAHSLAANHLGDMYPDGMD